jgi:hypothetical protein
MDWQTVPRVGIESVHPDRGDVRWGGTVTFRSAEWCDSYPSSLPAMMRAALLAKVILRPAQLPVMRLTYVFA